MVSSNNAINNTVGASISGVTNTLTVTNASNTASSAARETITVGGSSAGDPTLNFNVSGVTDWEMGIDNSSSDSLKISQGTALGTNDTWIMTTAGQRTMPLQSCFTAYLPTDDYLVTGDGTFVTLGSVTPLTISFDQNGDLTTAGVFTAPVTGNYLFCGSIIYYRQTVPIASSNNQGRVDIVTTSRTVVVNQFNPYNFQNLGGGSGCSYSLILPMTAGNTCYINCAVGGGSKTVALRGGAAGGCTFSGMLLC